MRPSLPGTVVEAVPAEAVSLSVFDVTVVARRTLLTLATTRFRFTQIVNKKPDQL
jgi:hypothetical protein